MRTIKKAFIEITNNCNLACPFCPGTLRPARFMPEDDFRAVVTRLRGRARCLYFHVMGEPLLHPALPAFLGIAGDAGFPVNLTTNGTLLDEVGKGLIGKPALRQVNISLHSRPDADGAYLDSVLGFVRAARRDGRVRIALRLWNGGAGSEAAATARLAAAFGHAPGLAGVRRDNRGYILADGVYFNRAAPFQWPGLACDVVGSKGYCRGLRDQIGILCDGTVVPCCLDGEGAVALGNLIHQDLDEILESQRAKELYDGFTRREAVEELCRRCGYRKRFG